MMKRKQWMSAGLALGVLAGALPLSGCAQTETDAYPGAHTITLQSTEHADGTFTHSAALDGAAVEEFDYTWHADPSEVHEDVKNCPAEYYTGTEPDTDAAVYIAHDITYYPQLDADGFQKVRYNGETEWAYYYTNEAYSDYIFATLPVSGSEVPTQMMHTEAEAYENAVLHITQPGTYILEGEWHGQIWIDLGDEDEVFTDESAKVTVVLNGVDVTCTVAAALVFHSVYECDNSWEERTEYSAAVDTTNAGAQVIVADGTENHFSGTNIYRMLKTKYKDESSTDAVPVQKKARKIDAAFYSFMSMNIDGEEEGTGVLNITSGFEGLDSELHLTINGGNVHINAQDDGINVNEDGVSVVTFNGGSTHILAGLGSEGDGIDSNGFLVVNGGTLISMANPISDSGMDSDCGTYINGGTVVALGSTMDWAESSEDTAGGQATMNLQFSASQSADEAIIVTDTEGSVVFAYDPDKDEVTGSNARSYRGAILSSPNFEVGGTYYIYVGGDVEGTETAGVYEVSTVTGFSEAAAQQCYTATGTLGGRPGGFGGERPEGFDGETPPALPEDFDGKNFDPGEKREMPEGFDGEGGQRPQHPEDMGERPEDFDPDDLPEDFDPSRFGGMMGEGASRGDGETVFTLSDSVNSFSGVMDYAPEEESAE